MSDTFIGDYNNVVTDDVVGLFTSSYYTKLYGIAGNDFLSTEIPGQALIDGGDGNDYIFTSWEAGVTWADFYGGRGNDWIQGGATNHADNIYAGQGDDFVDQQSGAVGGNDYIEGGQGRDALYGRAGNDTIYGGDGDDSGASITVGAGAFANSARPGLYGGAGNDFLDGGRGKDLLKGGPGKDLLIGGVGRDIFDFDNKSDSHVGRQRDTILDFERGDKIDLSNIDAKSGPGNQAFHYIGAGGFHHVKGELRFQGGIVSGDIDGNGKADFEIGVAHTSSLKGTDFIL